MSATSPRAAARRILIIVAVVQFVVGGWFSWTASRAKPHDVPVAVVDARLGDALRDAAPGAYRIERAGDAAEADRKLRDREVYGALLTAPKGVELHIASAASPAVAQQLTQQARQLAGGSPVAVTDLVPAAEDDAHGSGMALAFLPLLLTAVVAGLLFVLLVRDLRARLFGLVGFAVLSGLLSSLMLTHISGVLPGGYLANAGIVALLELAAAGFITGLGSLLGKPGIPVGAVLMFVVGNPLSGMASAPEMLPQPLGDIGQLLPAGAAATLFRSAGSFHGAGAGGPVLVLVVWAVLGLGLLMLSGRRKAAQASVAARPGRRPAAAAQ